MWDWSLLEAMGMDQVWWSLPVIRPLSRPRQHDQESEVSLQCVEKSYFTTETEQQQQTDKKADAWVSGVRKRTDAIKGKHSPCSFNCHLVTVDLGLWWQILSEVQQWLRPSTEFLFGLFSSELD